MEKTASTANRASRRACAAIALATLSCGIGRGQSESSGDEPAGSHGDSGSQSGASWTSFLGALRYVSRLDGVVRCDAQVALVGTPYTGECEDCDWVFSIESEITDDGELSQCAMAPQLSLVESDDFRALRLAFRSSQMSEDWWQMESAEDVLLVGYDSGADDAYLDEGWFEIASSLNDWGSAELTGSVLVWGIDLETEILTERYSEWCEDYVEFKQYESMGGDWTGESELDCEGEKIDIWAFETSQSDTIRLTVDTVSADTAFDPVVWLQGPDECVSIGADDSFDCTHSPSAYGCPTLLVEDAPVGAYRIVVASLGSCTGSSAVYQLQLGAPLSEAAVLLEDDTDRILTTIWEVEVQGEGELSTD